MVIVRPVLAPTLLALSLLAPAALTLGACGGSEVNCENLCKRTLACEVSFAPSDDLEGDKVKAGDRTDLESCTLGCEENPRVTVESASCVDDVEITTAQQCQQPVLDCFGVE
jgi:hypothetical protein